MTGSTGMVGSNVLEHPEAARHELLSPPRSELDLLHAAAVEAYVREQRPDCIIHCAGRVGGIQANLRAPVAFLTENLLMGTHLVQAAAKARVPRLLNLGSSCTYPKDSPELLCEDMLLSGKLEPTNEGYALAKIAVARLCDYVAQEEPDLRYKTIVPCNLYGRHDSFDLTCSHMLAAAIRKVHEAREHRTLVNIWGDGEVRREFMYAGDLAGFLFFALERYEEVPPLLNVGVGRDYTVNEYYENVARVLGTEVEFQHDLTKPVGTPRKLLDVSKAAALGWEASTSHAEGIRLTYEYFLATEARGGRAS